MTVDFFSTLYAILDPARSPEIYPVLRRLHPDAECLFGRDIPQAVREVSPHLVAFPEDGALITWWRTQGLGKSWGIACRTAADKATLRVHLKKFLRVYLPAGGLYLFRFWDPRVLTVFLSSAEASERADFFGPVEAFYAEETGTGRTLTFRSTDAREVP
ncbi:MAG TPA: DUF4123 domain-containing protein [Acidiphilium sp.]|uniref:DUF4123 domain-containing protein n=1 Tax=Acidiphilium sp. TaxID=527 RepID=UPI000BC6806C|nr:DUF4123 domain-containing protein [Acidiphilium sp.]OZB39386.1 MAG: hypothetical protein B7X48_09270 [Acidiphilium sp. 34-60-192]HQT89624.1 DUF4123 domain-containing protein [Acidiphilium sp.]